MKWFFAIIFVFSSAIFAGDKIQLELSSGSVIDIDTYSADGETMFLYLPSERGLGAGYVSAAQQLAFFGTDVWALDLHESYMVPKYRSSIERFDVKDVLELVEAIQSMGFKDLVFVTSSRGAQLALKVAYQWQIKHTDSDFIKGHIFHSPQLVSGKSNLGNKAEYVDISKVSNLPVYMVLPEFSTKYFHADEIAEQLSSGGSFVTMNKLKGVSGGFHMRKAQDLTLLDLKYRDDLTEIYSDAFQMMKDVDVTKPKTLATDVNKRTSPLFGDPVLSKYSGKQNIGLKLQTLKGDILDINDLINHVVLINFWASWCSPCVKEIPSLVRLQNKLKDQPFKIITINIGESKSRINEFMQKVKFDLPIMLDSSGDAVKDWGVYAYPSNFLLDKNGVIRYSYRGALEWDADSVVNTIKSLL